jgi:hypothetical protein
VRVEPHLQKEGAARLDFTCGRRVCLSGNDGRQRIARIQQAAYLHKLCGCLRINSAGNLLSPSPPGEKATTCQCKAGQASASDGAGDGYWREGLPCEDERDELVLKIW